MKFKYRHSIHTYCLGLLLLLPFAGCKKLVEVEGPISSINSANVFENDASAISVLTGQYIKMSTARFPAAGTINSFMPLEGGLAADEFILSGKAGGQQLLYYKNAYNALSIQNTGPSKNVYPQLFVVNSAIEGLTNATKLTPAVKQQLLGEAKFLRAFYYFYLTNLYGDVPLATTSDYKVSGLLARTAQTKVYNQIITDLLEAKDELSSNFVGIDGFTTVQERVRPNKWAASALLARTYLFNGNFKEAEAEATAVINENSLFSLTDLNKAFLKNSNEAIWQLQPVNQGWNTEDARFFIIPSSGIDGNHSVYLSQSLLNAFESGDQRKSAWVGQFTDKTVTPNAVYYYPYKYKSATQNAAVTEYQTILRLGELYLIRSEARAMQNNTGGSLADLNVIRNRAGLANYSGPTDQGSLKAAILHERQIELFSEFGHRWLDLKRTKTVDQVMTLAALAKGSTWDPHLALFPFALSDLQTDPNLVQNPGY